LTSPDTQKDANDNPETQPVSTTTAEPEAASAHEGHDHSHDHDHDHDHQNEQPLNTACVREISVEIPADVVSKQWDATVQRYSKLARVPGFRKGKVPASIIRSRFADDIRSDVLETLVPQYFRESVLKEGFRPVTEPRLSNLEMEAGNPIRFKAAFEILPEIELHEYKDVKVEKPETAVSDAEVEAELKALQERQASYDPVNEDRGLQNGDFAQISFKAVPKEETPKEPEQKTEGEQGAPAQQADAGQPVQMDEVLVEMGSPNTLPEFSQNLQDVKAGEEKTFEVTYPADYYEPRMAGKTFVYTAKVNAIKTKALPELNDDFAKELSQEFQGLDDLKKRIREGMEHERQHRADLEGKEKMLDQLLERHDFPVPETLIQHQIDSRLERGLRALAAQGMRPEDMKRMDFGRLRAGQRDGAIKEVKTNLLMVRIADEEKIEVSDQELHHEIHLIARQMNEPPETLVQKYNEDGTLDEIRARMRVAKTLNLLYNKAIGNEENTAA
jgi:trigger factor